MIYRSHNPYTGEEGEIFPLSELPDWNQLAAVQQRWADLSVAQRLEPFAIMKGLLLREIESLARIITAEMGKPYRESVHELEKCVTAIDYYRHHAEAFLAPRPLKDVSHYAAVHPEPLGLILGVMPWNFPFWQVLRFAIPTLTAGNVVLIKHAPNVPGCSLALEDLFIRSGFPHGVYTQHFWDVAQVEQVLADDHLDGLSFTGSEATGSHLAGLAGRGLKKAVMELGGNDPFIVFPDADIEETVQAAVRSRKINSGQACNGAKRFLVHAEVYTSFIARLTQAVEGLSVSDPMEATTDIGPLARLDLAEKVRRQIHETVQQGARLHQRVLPSGYSGCFVMPAVLENVQPGMTAFEEEIFGPVFSVTAFSDTSAAVSLANATRYGLAASIWTKDHILARALIPKLRAGNVYVNEVVKSDPRLPFGGVRKSGFGRELAEFGLLEFVNLKTVFIR